MKERSENPSFPHKKTMVSAAVILALSFLPIGAAMAAPAGMDGSQTKERLVVENRETGEVYADVPIEAGDEVSFGWTHSFEHIPWNEYYEVEPDGSFLLHTISVAGFGAGIPAEMDCTYRYEDGLIYMDDIESRFEQFNWINSQTALREIAVNGKHLLAGEDMPHHEKMILSIKKKGGNG